MCRDAKITAINTETGLTRNSETSDVGFYNLTGLPVGTYDLTIDAQGFKTVKRTGLQLQVGAVATIDLRMEVGNAQETVSVAAETPWWRLRAPPPRPPSPIRRWRIYR